MPLSLSCFSPETIAFHANTLNRNKNLQNDKEFYATGVARKRDTCRLINTYGIAACSAAAGELGLQNFQGASPANPKRASKDRSSTSPERSLGSFESAGNSTSKFDYWVPANVKAPRALFKHPRGIASTPYISTSYSVLSSNPVYSLVNLGIPNSIATGSNRLTRSLGRARTHP